LIGAQSLVFEVDTINKEEYGRIEESWFAQRLKHPDPTTIFLRR